MLNKNTYIKTLVCSVGFLLAGTVGVAQQTILTKTVYDGTKTFACSYVHSYELTLKEWQALPQLHFWSEVVRAQSDSSIVNIASTREPLFKVPTLTWAAQTEPQKDTYKDSVKRTLALDSNTVLYVTAGKREFYEFKKAVDLVGRGVSAFRKYGVDPWYAQAILIIESPGQLRAKSSAGAYGAFQLMPEVARAFGLKVNRKIDERSNFDRSAMAASRFIKVNCIPFSKKICNAHGLAYKESDLWFKLLTMHIYNAGYGNVAAAVDKLCPSQGGIEFVKGLWQTQAAQFKNQSQNYTQILLACMSEFQKIMHQGDTVYLSDGDMLYASTIKLPLQLRSDGFKKCMLAYQSDVIDGILTPEQFKNKIEILQRSSGALSNGETYAITAAELNYVGNKLLVKRNMKGAIEIFEYNQNLYPENKMVYDSLHTAYSMIGNKVMAKKYAKLSSESGVGRLSP